MAYQCRARKRVRAVPRGPDGSAFQKCENCGLSVAIALADMHECGGRFKKTGTKKLKAQLGHGDCKGQRIEDQPRSAFRFFVDDFMETCKDGNEVEVENKACEIWKNMSKVERRPFVLQADKLNSAYVKLLQEEENEIQWVDDEADSAEVGKYDKNYEMFNVYYDSESSDASGLFLSDEKTFICMDDKFGGVITKEWHKEDMKALTSQLKEHESVLRLKRRWLMDLPLSTTEETGVEELMSGDKILPESLLREDDVGYENIKTCIEMGFGAHKPGKEQSGVQEDIQIFKSREDFKDIFFLLDGMTNKGLCSFAGILTGGMIKFEKTNWSMRRTIKEHLQKKITDEICTSEIKLKQLSQLVVDPANFRGQMVVSTSSEAYYDAANKVLDGLEDLCSRTLNAMRRKLEGVKGFIPTMQPKKSGKGRDSLISLVRKRSMKMLSDLGKGGEPAEQLTSALGVAGLALKHLLNRPVALNFRNFLQEVEALQIDIVKAIWLLNKSKRVSIIELKRVQALLDPNVELSARSLRMGVRNLLTEYLFECSDMDKVPGCLIKTLDIINGKSDLRSHGKKSSAETHVSPQDLVKEEMQKEVECVLTVSGQAKEVLLDWLPEHEFDEDFAHAYMEDLEESDTLFTSDDDDEGQTGDVPKHSAFDSHNSHSHTESIGETIPVELNSPVSTSNTYGCSPVLSPNGSLNTPLESTDIKEMDLDKTPGCDHSELLLESEIQCGQRMNRTQNSLSCAVKLEVVFPEPLEARSMQNLSSLPPSFAWNSNKNDIKNEEPTGRSSVIPKFEPLDFLLEQRDVGSHQRKLSNPYLEIQEACDATSMVAYRFVGHMLDELAMTDNIELYQGDRFYLLSGASIPEDSEESPQTLLTSRFRGMWKDVLER